MVTAGETPEDAKARIREIGKALEEEEQSERLIRKMEEELAAAGKIREALQHSPSVMFIYARGQNNLMVARSEEHTSELQSRGHLVCRLLLEKKNKISAHC